MHPLWRDLLIASTAEIGPDEIPRFATIPSDAPGCRLFDLSHLGLIAAQGADAATFLQGQLTNDVRELSDTHVQWSSHCSQKGRMLASFLLMRIDDTFYLQLPRTGIPDLLERLRRFVLRSRVKLDDVSDDLARIAIVGEAAAACVAERGLGAPELENGLAITGEVAVIRLPGPLPRFELIGTPLGLAEHWSAFLTQATPANVEDWALLDIRAGIPTIEARTADAFVPQMANMQLIDGVSFHKGCYTGQEVVARMQYLGKLKRRMYLAEVASEQPPRPGDELFSPASTSQQGSGTVVASSPVGAGRHALLAVVEVKAAEDGEVQLSADGPRLDFQPLPYAFQDQGAEPA